MKTNIDESAFLNIGNVEQFVLIRSKNIDNPVLLLLHGGNTETPHFAKFNKDLEKYFTVIYWDQRGEGKSNQKNIDVTLLTLKRYIEDIHELTQYLKSRFKKEKIYLLGHSMGTLFGMKTIEKYPQDYIMYIAVSQVADPIKSDNLACDMLVKRANDKNNQRDIKKIDSISRVTKENIAQLDIMKRTNDLLSLSIKYGGLYYKASIVKMLKISLLPILTFKEYSLKDKIIALKQHKERIVFYYQNEIFNTILKVKVPILFIHGKDDYIINYDLTKEYYEKLDAPYKEFVTFEKSGHFPPFEEAEKFSAIMIDKVLKYNKTLS